MRTIALSIVAALALGAGTSFAQEPTVVKGAAILKHPIGALALRVAELMTAGKIDESVALRSGKGQAEWKVRPPRSGSRWATA